LRAFQEIFDEEIIPGSPLYNLLLDHYYPYKREIRVFQNQEILLHISPSDPAYGYRGGYNYTDFFLSYWYLYNFDPANIKMWVAREEKEDIQRFYKKRDINHEYRLFSKFRRRRLGSDLYRPYRWDWRLEKEKYELKLRVKQAGEILAPLWGNILNAKTKINYSSEFEKENYEDFNLNYVSSKRFLEEESEEQKEIKKILDEGLNAYAKTFREFKKKERRMGFRYKEQREEIIEIVREEINYKFQLQANKAEFERKYDQEQEKNKQENNN